MPTTIVTAIDSETQDSKTPSALSCLEALRTVPPSQGRTVEALQALYGMAPGLIDRTSHNDSRKISESVDLYLWRGAIPHSKALQAQGKPPAVGEYWSPNLYHAKSILRELANPKKPKGWKKGDYFNPRGVLTMRSGIGAADIAAHCINFTEIDTGPLEEQAAKIDWLEEKLGIRFTLLVLSGDTREGAAEAAGVTPENLVGGKSIHAFWGGPDQTPDQWLEIQLLAMALLNSDESLKNSDRLMRFPGVVGHEFKHRTERTGRARLQTILRVGDPVDNTLLLARLKALCAEMGVTPPSAGGGIGGVIRKGNRKITTTGKEETGDVHHVDFRTHIVEGTGLNLLAWTQANLQPGEETEVGFPFAPREKGDGILGGSSCRLRLSDNGQVWLYSFKHPEGKYFHQEEVTRETFGLFEMPLSKPKEATKVGTPILPQNDPDIDGLDLDDVPGTTNVQTVRGSIDVVPGDHTPSYPLQTMTVYTPETLVQGKYLPPAPLTHRLTGVLAPHGTGKSELARFVVESLPEEHAPVVSIVHRTSLATAHAQRFGLLDYQLVEGKLSGDVAVCINSLTRVETLTLTGHLGAPEDKQFGLVILDEVVQLLRNLFQGTMRGWEAKRARETLKVILRNAEKVLVLDADLDTWAFNQLRDLMGIDREDGRDQELRWAQVPVKYTYRVDPDITVTDKALFEAWSAGEKVAVHCQSKRGSASKGLQLAETHEEEWVVTSLQKARPMARLLLINSDTVRTPEVKAFLADTNRATLYDALIYTSSAGTGVSIDVTDHFDRTFAYSAEGVGTVEDLMQGVHRVRNPKNLEITICCPQGRYGSAQRDAKKIYETRDELRTLTDKLLGPGARPVVWGEFTGPGGRLLTWDEFLVSETQPVEGTHQPDPGAKGHNRAYCEVISYQRTHGGIGGNRREALLGYLKVHGSTVTETTPLEDEEEVKAIRKAARGASHAITQGECERIAAADLISIATAREVKVAKDQKEADSVSRAYLMDFYGEVTPELIKWDNQGRGRSMTRTFARFVAFQKDPVKVMAMDNRDRSLNVPTFGLRFQTLQAKVMTNLLVAAGYDPKDTTTWPAKILKNEDMPSALGEYAKKYRARLEEMGISVRADVDRDPIKLISTVMSKMGLTLNNVKVDGQRIYNVSAGSLATMASRSEKYLQRLLTGKAEESTGGTYLIRDRDAWSARLINALLANLGLDPIMDGQKLYCVSAKFLANMTPTGKKYLQSLITGKAEDPTPPTFLTTDLDVLVTPSDDPLPKKTTKKVTPKHEKKLLQVSDGTTRRDAELIESLTTYVTRRGL